MEGGFDRQAVYGAHSVVDQKISRSSQTAVTDYDTKEQLNMI